MAHYAMAVCALTKGQWSSIVGLVRRTTPYPVLDQSLSISLLQSIGCKLRVTTIICSNMTKAKVKDVIIRCYSLQILNINNMYSILSILTAQRSGLARWTSDPKVVGSNPIVVGFFICFYVSLVSFIPVLCCTLCTVFACLLGRRK